MPVKLPEDAQVVAVLKKVSYPGYSRDIVSFGFVKDVKVSQDGRVTIQIELPSSDASQIPAIEEDVRREVGNLAGVETVEVQVTAQEPRRAAPQGVPPTTQEVRGVSNIVAVASGKGGVGSLR